MEIQRSLTEKEIEYLNHFHEINQKLDDSFVGIRQERALLSLTVEVMNAGQRIYIAQQSGYEPASALLVSLKSWGEGRDGFVPLIQEMEEQSYWKSRYPDLFYGFTQCTVKNPEQKMDMFTFDKSKSVPIRQLDVLFQVLSFSQYPIGHYKLVEI